MGVGFTIPNEADATAAGYTEQADIDSIDFYIMQQGLAGYGVISGCQVTAQASPDLTVAVAPGLVQLGPQQLHVPGGNSSNMQVSSSNPRYTLIVINPNSGTPFITRVSGTAAASPVFPTPNAGTVVLAAVTVPTNATSVAAAQIVDKRVFVNSAFSTAGKLYLASVDWTRSRP